MLLGLPISDQTSGCRPGQLSRSGKYPTINLPEKYLKGQYGGLIGFGIKGGLEPAKKFTQKRKIVLSPREYRGCKSLVIHPAPRLTHNLQSKNKRDRRDPDYIAYRLE